MDWNRLKDARIMVLDDQPANVRILQLTLTRAGYVNVMTTTDPREALRLFDEVPLDLIVLDLMMPEIDGFHVLEEIRTRLPEDSFLPVLVLTADVNPEARDRALLAGAKDFVTKPFDHTEVLLRIANLLETRFLHLDLLDQNEALERRVQERTEELSESLRMLQRVDEQRQQLLSRLVTAQEEERRTIAADIHDDSVQVMVAVGIRLQMLARRLEDPEQIGLLAGLDETVARALARLRSLMFDLRPPSLDRDGLAAALREYVDREDETGLDCRIEWRLTGEPSPDVRVILYRIAQEVLTNVRKHARAGQVTVVLESQENGVLVRIEDDGIGFTSTVTLESPTGHLGLTAIRERSEMAGGRCHLWSAPGKGTTVEVWIPDSLRSGAGQLAESA